MTKYAGNCGLVTFTEENLNGKLHFFCSETCWWYWWNLSWRRSPSYRTQSNYLQRKPMKWLHMIGTSVIKELTGEAGTVWTFPPQKIDMFSTMLWPLKFVEMESIRFVKIYQNIQNIQIYRPNIYRTLSLI